MSSRDKIMAVIRGNQPDPRELPSLNGLAVRSLDDREMADADLTAYCQVLEAIGGKVVVLAGTGGIEGVLKEHYPEARRIVSGLPELLAGGLKGDEDPHSLEDVDVAVLRAHFGVAENGASWITEDRMVHRVLPFICQNLVLVVDRRSIVGTMHDAYERIAAYEAGGGSYNFATFIAGPSKTADIEQSLVLGAHGPKSLLVILLDLAESASGEDLGFF